MAVFFELDMAERDAAAGDRAMRRRWAGGIGPATVPFK